MTQLYDNPYVGPRTFTRQEGDRFFGREREARDLFSLVVSERLALFYAQSGAGKSSLINTRLIPQLQEAGFAVLPVGRVSGELPEGMSQVSNIFVFNLMLSLDQGDHDPHRFTPLPLTDFLARLTSDDGEHYYYYEAEAKVEAEAEAEVYVEVPSVLIIDQFEEIITSHSARWPEREGFFRQLDEAMAANPLLWVVLTLREDFVAALDPYAPLLTSKLRARFYMQRMGYEAALEAVKKPAEHGGGPFAPGVAESLVDNLRQVRVEGQAETQLGQFVEPVQLQVVCYQLWENLKDRPSGEITQQDLQELGNVDMALAEFYEQALQKTLQQTSLSEIDLRNWFDQKLITEAGTRGTVYQGPQDTAGLPNPAVKLLADQFLLRAEIRGGGVWYELVHDRFVEPILQANRAWQLRQSPLVQAAQAWERSGRSKDKLYTGQLLQDALASVNRETLEPLVQAFLTASEEENRAQEAEARRQAEEERAREAEARAREQSKVAKRRIVMMGVLVALTLIVAALSYLGSIPATQSIERTDELRAPTALTAAQAQAHLLQMLSDVRAYLAAGDEEYIESYNRSRRAFEADLAELEKLSPNFDPDNQRRLADLKAAFAEWPQVPERLFALRNDQFEREPAFRLLMTDGIELGGNILFTIQNMIDAQTRLEPTAQNLALLKNMADFQTSFSSSLSSLRAYVTTRNRIFLQEFEANFASQVAETKTVFQIRWEQLVASRNELTADQQLLLDEIAKDREAFLKFADEALAITAGEQWREDLYLFRTEATPLAETMRQLLAEITDNQQRLLQSDLKQGRVSLNRVNQYILLGGVVALLLGLGMMYIELQGARMRASWAARRTNLWQQILRGLSQPFVWVGLLITVVLGVAFSLSANFLAVEGVQTPIAAITEAIPSLPTGRGAGGVLKLLYWQAPTMLNPHLTSASQDWGASRITYEPLASVDKEGNLIPFLAAEIPSLANGGLASDGKSVTWKLKPGVKWSDGEPFTAADVLFTYEFISNPEVGAASASIYQSVKSVEVIDDYTVKVNFTGINPAWSLPFVGPTGMILPHHIFQDFNGSNAAEAPANLLPVGTGPYRVVPPGIKKREILFLQNEMVQTNKIIFEPNPFFRESDKPFFSRIELRGGSTANEAARQVLQTGEVDFAWNLQIDAEILSQLEREGRGKTVAVLTSFVERIYFNFTDPNQSAASGERSSLEFPHPFFSDLKVRQAFTYAVDRESIAALYGQAFQPASNILVSPAKYNSPNTSFEFNLEKAAALLDEAGWVDTNGDGMRDKNGQEMEVEFLTTANPLRQETQRIIQRALKSIGVDLEIKVIDSSSFFDSDPTNPNTAYHFYADLQMYNDGNLNPDPGSYMQYLTTDQIPQQHNNWTGENVGRWQNPKYDALYQQSTTEIDPDKRAQLFIQMNDKIIEDAAVIPLVHRARVIGVTPNLSGVDPTPWDAEIWNIKDWSGASP